MGWFNRNKEENEQTAMPRNPDSVFFFRALASGYILYLVYEIVKMYIAGEEGASLPVVIISSVVLGGGAIYILISSFLRWRREKAELAQQAQEEDEALLEEETEDNE